MPEPMSDERLAEIRAWDAERNPTTVRKRPNSAVAHRHELLAEVERARAELAAATARAETAEAAYHRLDSAQAAEVAQLRLKLATRGDLMNGLDGEVEGLRARAEQAEAELAELRERLGGQRRQWGVRMRDTDAAEDIEVMSNKAQARECATAWRGEIPNTNPTVMYRTERLVGQWRGADAAPSTALERATAEQDVGGGAGSG